MSNELDRAALTQCQQVLESLVTSLLISKPDDPVPHIIQYLQDKKGVGAPPLSKDEKLELNQLREELKKLTGKEVQINIFEIKRPELDAKLVAESVARQIEARISHRRAIKMAIAGTMRLGAEGIKINIAGRVNGAEIARSESYKEGRIPLHTFRADIDYALMEAHTTYGRIGIKCWICRGEIYGKKDLSPIPPQKHSKDRRPGNASRQGGGRRRTRN